MSCFATTEWKRIRGDANMGCIFSGKEGADASLRATGNAGRKQKKGGEWERDGSTVLAWSVCPRLLMCVSPVFINQSQAVCCRAGVSCSVIWVSGGMCEPHPTLLEPPTHSISNCKQTASASVGGGTGRRSSIYTVFVLACVFAHVWSWYQGVNCSVTFLMSPFGL